MLPGLWLPPGLRVAEGGLVLPSYSYRNRYTSTTNSASYLFSNCDIGPAAADRLIVVCVHWAANTDRALDIITIAGEDGTVHASYEPDEWSQALVASRAVPAGTTANIGFTLSGSANHAAVGVFALYGLQSHIPYDAPPLGSPGPVSVAPDGILIAAATGRNNGGTIMEVPTFRSGITEHYNNTRVESLMVPAGAGGVFPAGHAGFDPTVASGGFKADGAGASWR